MVVTHETVIRNAGLPERADLTSVGIDDGRVARVGTDLPAGESEIDARGGLVAGGFVDCHVHLDKALVVDSLPPNGSGTLREAIETSRRRKAEYTVADVRQRPVEAIEMHVRNGCSRGKPLANAGAVMDVPHGVEAGLPETLNAFPPSVTSRTVALRAGRRPAHVLHRGRVVAEHSRASKLRP